MAERDSTTTATYSDIVYFEGHEAWVEVAHQKILHDYDHARQTIIVEDQENYGENHTEGFPVYFKSDEQRREFRRIVDQETQGTVKTRFTRVSHADQEKIKRRELVEHDIDKVVFQQSPPIDPAQSETW